MTNQATSAELSRLPEPVQEQLIRIYRLAAGMDAREKTACRLMLGGLSFGFALNVPDDAVPAAEMISALGVIVTAIDELASAGTEA